MKLGTQIRFSDGRIATVIYNSLVGVGIKWGSHDPDTKDFESTNALCRMVRQMAGNGSQMRYFVIHGRIVNE